MDTEFFDIIRSWPKEYQLGFFGFSIALFFLLVYNIISSLTACMKSLFGVHRVEKEEAQECPREDNLTGLCLRKGGCKTDDECRYIVNELTYRKED